MKTVSDEYQSSMSQILRNRSYVQILLENADRDTQSDGAWTDNGHASESDLASLDWGGSAGGAYATLELNRWILDGSTNVYETIPADGYVSSEMSDENGAYTTAPTLTREFSTEHPFVGMSIQFDARATEWPVSATVELYLDGELVYMQALERLTSPYVNITADIEAFDKAVLYVNRVLPYRRFRVEEVLFGISRTYTNDKIIETVQTHNVDPLTRRLPDEEMSFTIIDFEHEYDPDNPDGIYDYVDENSSVSLTFGYDVNGEGKIEWLKPDQYVLTAKPTASEGRVRFQARGWVNLLSGVYYKALHGSKTLYSLANSVLTDANLGKTRTNEDPWVIDDSLNSIYTEGILPIDTHMNCLQLIAHAACCRLYTDDDNIVHIEPESGDAGEITGNFWVNEFSEDLMVDQEEEDSTVYWIDDSGHLMMTVEVGVGLDFSTIDENTQSVTKIDQLKSVKTALYSYVPAAEAETLYEETTTATNLHIEFGLASGVSVSVAGGSALATNLYAQAVDLVLSEGTKTVTITGKPITVTPDYATTTVNASGEDDIEENVLITSEPLRDALTQHVVDWLQYRNTYDFDYRGNPELEVGDIIGFETRYSPGLIGMVLTDEITFNGALHGHIKVKTLW